WAYAGIGGVGRVAAVGRRVRDQGLSRLRGDAWYTRCTCGTLEAPESHEGRGGTVARISFEEEVECRDRRSGTRRNACGRRSRIGGVWFRSDESRHRELGQRRQGEQRPDQ